MYISPIVRMKKIHIWMGSYFKGTKNYEEYFNQDDLPCQFCKDIGIEEYDDDFIGVIPLFNYEADIQTLLLAVPIDEREKAAVLMQCDSLGIKKGNAIFYLTDSSVYIKETEKTYNGILYIGVYDSSL